MISLKFIYLRSLRVQFYTKGNVKAHGISTFPFIYSHYTFNWLNKALSMLLNISHFNKNSLITNSYKMLL